MPKEYKAKKLAFQPKPLVVEKKFHNVTISAAALPGAGVWSTGVTLNQIAQGTGPTDRIGKAITLKNVNLRFEALTSGFVPCRALLIYDKQPQGSIPTITEILTADSFNAHHNLLNSERFVTLIDIVHNPGGSNCTMEEFRKCELPLTYKLNAGTPADFATGAIYVYFAASSVLAAASTFNARMVMRFTDC